MNALNTYPVNILLVEDDDADIDNVRRALAKRRIGNPLFVAHDGIEAMELLDGGEIEKPILILLDINLPRMDGLEFLKRMRASEAHADHVVFVLSVSARQSDVLRAYDLQIAGFMNKSDVGDGFLEAMELVDDYWRVIQAPRH